MTPKDAIMIVRPHRNSRNSVVQLCQGDTIQRRLVTKLEVVALLAAWRSQLPPPSMERLSDWW
ncbi:MAG: hypothetical protein AABZ47_01920 [Planctomycetota bacterium]